MQENNQNNDQLILVDKDDNILGYQTKEKVHQNNGILHRAFSVFLFNDKQELLLQKRSKAKLLWPLFWSNSVCSHPRQGESMAEATQRRLQEELNTQAQLEYLFKFDYQAQFKNLGGENELCYVYIGKISHPIKINENEIADFKYINYKQILAEIAANRDCFSPWFKMEWERIDKEYLPQIEKLFNAEV